LFLRDLQGNRRADERTRTADLTSLRVSLFPTCTTPGMAVLQAFVFLQCSSSNRLYRQISPLLLTFVDVPFQSLIVGSQPQGKEVKRTIPEKFQFLIGRLSTVL
jgi:hypothetical protein